MRASWKVSQLGSKLSPVGPRYGGVGGGSSGDPDGAGCGEPGDPGGDDSGGGVGVVKVGPGRMGSPVRGGEGQPARVVGVADDYEVAGMVPVVVVRAQASQVPGVGRSAVDPVDEVVAFGAGAGAAGESAATVAVLDMDSSAGASERSCSRAWPFQLGGSPPGLASPDGWFVTVSRVPVSSDAVSPVAVSAPSPAAFSAVSSGQCSRVVRPARDRVRRVGRTSTGTGSGVAGGPRR